MLKKENYVDAPLLLVLVLLLFLFFFLFALLYAVANSTQQVGLWILSPGNGARRYACGRS